MKRYGWSMNNITDLKINDTNRHAKEVCLCLLERLVKWGEPLVNKYPMDSFEFDWCEKFKSGYNAAHWDELCPENCGEPFRRGYNAYKKKHEPVEEMEE